MNYEWKGNYCKRQYFRAVNFSRFAEPKYKINIFACFYFRAARLVHENKTTARMSAFTVMKYVNSGYWYGFNVIIHYVVQTITLWNRFGIPAHLKDTTHLDVWDPHEHMLRDGCAKIPNLTLIFYMQDYQLPLIDYSLRTLL